MMPRIDVPRALGRFGIALWCAAAALPAIAQFSLAISPPRFELSARPGERVREIVEFTHTGTRPGAYTVKTADWTLQPDGSVDFVDALLPGSCRPWVAIERRELAVSQGRPYRFRFEVAPPADTPPAECRFALMVEGRSETVTSGVPLAFAARIGLIVYVAVGDVAPVIELAGTGLKQLDGRTLPAIRIRNSGSAHGRLAGYLNGTDASGARLEFQPESSAILPGETRDIALIASKPGDADAPVTVSFPLTITGKVEWGATGSTLIDHRFTR